MILKYGNYQHDPNECAVVIAKRAHFSPRGEREFVRETWHIAGIKQAASQGELTAALALLRAAYGVDGRDAALYLDDGTTPSDHSLVSSAALGGVRVTGLEFPRGDGAEYSTFRTFALTLEADFPEAAGNLLEYDESLGFEGTGGPRRVFLEVLEGLPQEQIGTQRTTCRATQTGRAVGAAGYPVVPPPIWPAAELPDRRRLTLHTPQHIAGRFTRYAVEWSYSFESAIGLSGGPTVQ